ASVAEHVGPQSMPPAPPTYPVPEPDFTTVRVNIGVGGGGLPNPAVTSFGPLITIVQVGSLPYCSQEPPQVVNSAPSSGVAVSTRSEFCRRSAEQEPGQSNVAPLSLPVTCPGPDTLIVTWKCSVRAAAVDAAQPQRAKVATPRASARLPPRYDRTSH